MKDILELKNEEKNLFERAEKALLKGELEKKSLECDSLKKKCDSLVSEIEQKNAEIEHLNEEIEELLDENDCLNQENSRMTKILTEKNNAERNISPKKEKSGYLLQSIQQTNSSYQRLQGYDWVSERLDCWEYRIETPYKFNTQPRVNMTKVHVKNDLLFDRLSVFEVTSNARDEVISKEVEDLMSYINYAFDVRFGMNPRTGYWYLIFRTLYEIDSELLADL